MPTFTREIHGHDLPVLVVSGELDISTQPTFRNALHQIEPSATRVLIDFCRCSYFDSSVLTELLRFRKAREDRQEILLSVPHPNCRRVIDITHLDRVFSLVDCVHRVA